VYLGAIIHEEVVLGSPKLREKYGFKDLWTLHQNLFPQQQMWNITWMCFIPERNLGNLLLSFAVIN
jgi:hypothetical protein